MIKTNVRCNYIVVNGGIYPVYAVPIYPPSNASDPRGFDRSLSAYFLSCAFFPFTAELNIRITLFQFNLPTISKTKSICKFSNTLISRMHWESLRILSTLLHSINIFNSLQISSVYTRSGSGKKFGPAAIFFFKFIFVVGVVVGTWYFLSLAQS